MSTLVRHMRSLVVGHVTQLHSSISYRVLCRNCVILPHSPSPTLSQVQVGGTVRLLMRC